MLITVYNAELQYLYCGMHVWTINLSHGLTEADQALGRKLGFTNNENKTQIGSIYLHSQKAL